MDENSVGVIDSEKQPLECSVERAIHWVGGKWKLYIIRLLLYSGPCRFNQLRRGIDGISNKVLTENLRELEDLCIVERLISDADWKSEAYALTPSGTRLLPVLKAFGDWADAHIQQVH